METGPEVDGVSVGDHVVLSWFAPCGRCLNCAAGRAWLFDLADQGKSILGCNYGSSVAKIDIPKLANLYLAGLLPLGEHRVEFHLESPNPN